MHKDPSPAETADVLNAAIKNVEFTDIPLVLARALGHTALDPAQKRQGIQLLRRWVNYTQMHSVSGNPFAVRYHIPRFAQQEFGTHTDTEHLRTTGIYGLEQHGQTFANILAQASSPDIIEDPHVAIIGGTARVALKMHAGIDVGSELPVSDIDAVMSTGATVEQSAAHYGIDLTGCKIVDGSVQDALLEILSNVDCTMNQVAVYNGQLYFTDAALRDITEGNIRLTHKNEPLFGSEGEMLDNGEIHLNRKGFYRGLSFLIRGKGDRLIVSQENLDEAKDTIGRYWPILLFVKLLPAKDDAMRYRYIGHWHDIARRIGSTSAETPVDFLGELQAQYPEVGNYGSPSYDAEKQSRWIIHKMISTGVTNLFQSPPTSLPQTYTPAHLTLSPSFAEYDYGEFMDAVEEYRTTAQHHHIKSSSS